MLTIGRQPIALPDILPGASTFTSKALNASNVGVGAVLIAKAGTIHQIGINVASKTTPPTYRLSIQGLTGRAPDGSIKGGGTAKVDTVPATTGWIWNTLDADLAVNDGDKLSIVCAYLSGTVDASHLITANYQVVMNTTDGTPYALAQTAGTWAAGANAPNMGIKYLDGTVHPGMYCGATLVNNAINSASNPIFYGNKWTPQYNCRVVGCKINIQCAAGSNFNLKMFADTTLVLTTPVIVNTDVSGVGAIATLDVPLPATTLTAGTAYRFVIEPITTTAFTKFVSFSFADAASVTAIGGELTGTTGTATPVWTDIPFDCYPIIPIIDQIAAGGVIVVEE